MQFMVNKVERRIWNTHIYQWFACSHQFYTICKRPAKVSLHKLRI